MSATYLLPILKRHSPLGAPDTEGLQALVKSTPNLEDLTVHVLAGTPNLGHTSVEYLAVRLAREVVRLQRIIDNAVSSMDALHAAAQKD